MLEYVRDNGCALPENSCELAIGNLEYVHDNGCSLPEDSCKLAIKNANLNMLKYVHTNGCVLSKNLCEFANETSILKYIQDNAESLAKEIINITNEGIEKYNLLKNNIKYKLDCFKKDDSVEYSLLKFKGVSLKIHNPIQIIRHKCSMISNSDQTYTRYENMGFIKNVDDIVYINNRL